MHHHKDAKNISKNGILIWHLSGPLKSRRLPASRHGARGALGAVGVAGAVRGGDDGVHAVRLGGDQFQLSVVEIALQGLLIVGLGTESFV